MNVHSAHVQARTAHGHGPEELLQVVWQVGAPGIAGIHSYEDADVGVQPHLHCCTWLGKQTLLRNSATALAQACFPRISISFLFCFVPCLYG